MGRDSGDDAVAARFLGEIERAVGGADEAAPSPAWSGKVATPRLAVIWAVTAGTFSPSKLARMVSAALRAPVLLVSGSRTMNSSPPQRPAKSLTRTLRRNVAAKVSSTSSPT